jgi:hypothetical protein
MTLSTIRNIVAFCQREKVVVHPVGGPVKPGYVVAVDTIGGKSGALVAGAAGCSIIGTVAVDTIVADTVESQIGFGGMAIDTGRAGVRAEQRKTVVLVQFRYIIDQPTVGVVAAGAVVADGPVVHVLVAGDAVGPGI